MKIGILGTRGIPNHYGGFEQFAEHFSVYMAAQGHDVWVYNSSSHPYSEHTYKGVNIISVYDPEKTIGTVGQFVYDALCIRDSRKRNFDVLLQLGYTSSSVFSFMMPNQTVIVTNMDGLEWKRSKYSPTVQKFLKRAERWAALKSDYLIADSIGIQNHLLNTYHKQSEYIPYGAEIFDKGNSAMLPGPLTAGSYHLLIARMEPENNIETIIKATLSLDKGKPLVVVGNYNNRYGTMLFKKYHSDRIRFVGGIYDTGILNNLRWYADWYFHGHSVGGTNPSLIEAMACSCAIIAHDNVFNRSILGEKAPYFSNEQSLVKLLNMQIDRTDLKKNNSEKVQRLYKPDILHRQLEVYLLNCLNNGTTRHS